MGNRGSHQQHITELEQEISDLKIELITAIEHGDSIDDQLMQINDQLLKEIQERHKAEKALQKLTDIIQQEKQDLELLVETVTDHSDRLDLQWLDQYQTVQDLALTDGLTNIANRRHFNDFLHKEWHRAIRHGYSIALIMIDIDHFKLYNDTYGHPQGDLCLEQVAGVLKKVCKRNTDFVARYGGEEFAIIISDTAPQNAKQVADQVHQEIASLKIEHSSSLTSDQVTISLGLAVTQPRAHSDEQQFISFADHLLYGAKRNGRNRTEMAVAKLNSQSEERPGV